MGGGDKGHRDHRRGKGHWDPGREMGTRTIGGGCHLLILYLVCIWFCYPFQNVPGAPTMEGESADGGPSEYPMHPSPAVRVPLLPMDPREPFFRRPFPMHPPPMDMYGPSGYPALPPPHIARKSALCVHPDETALLRCCLKRA